MVLACALSVMYVHTLVAEMPGSFQMRRLSVLVTIQYSIHLAKLLVARLTVRFPSIRPRKTEISSRLLRDKELAIRFVQTLTRHRLDFHQALSDISQFFFFWSFSINKVINHSIFVTNTKKISQIKNLTILIL